MLEPADPRPGEGAVRLALAVVLVVTAEHPAGNSALTQSLGKGGQRLGRWHDRANRCGPQPRLDSPEYGNDVGRID